MVRELYGPPGTGKTTLANIIANVTGKKYIKLNAVNCGVKEIKEAIDNSKRRFVFLQWNNTYVR